jgi:hypothetical protein
MKRPLRKTLEISLLCVAGAGLLVSLGICVLRNGPGQSQSVQAHPVPDDEDIAGAPSHRAVPPIQLAARDTDGGDPAFRTVAGAPALDVHESFDNTAAGKLPAEWAQWKTGGASFEASSAKALSGANSLACAGGSTAAARAWMSKPLAADAQASAAVFLNTLVPAQVLVRGIDLETAAPSYYGALVTRGLEVQLVRVVKGTPTAMGTIKSSGYVSEKWVRLTLCAEGKDLRVQVQRLDTNEYLSDGGKWQADTAWALTATDKEIAGPGQFGVGRVARYAGTLYFDDFTATRPAPAGTPPAVAVTPKPADKPAKPSEPPAKPAVTAAPSKPVAWQRPEIPRHYSHIRIALLAYHGNPMGSFEDKLLRESVDLIVTNQIYLKHVHEVAPKTPQLIYTNTSNLYQGLTFDWLLYADAHGISREVAFYHAAHATPFSGDSPSSQPVTWFWGVYRGSRSPVNVTAAAHAKAGRCAFGEGGESLYVGYPDRFREINLTLNSPAGRGWSAVLEYPKAADDGGAPKAWATLATVSDTTAGLTRSGQVTFDPPADWKTAAVGDSGRLYYVRFRTMAGASPPVAASILSRDYVGAKGTTAGTVPAFDAKADANGDGYLDDAEYAKRAPGKDARFLYESRMLTESYGQMRYGTRPADAGFRAWCVDYHVRLLRDQPLAGGLFMDNAHGKPPVRAGDVLEPLDAFGEEFGAILHAIGDAIAPRLVLANTAGGTRTAESIIRQSPFYFEEFALRPLAHHHATVEDLAGIFERRAALTSPAPYAVIDSHPQKGSPTDPRLQLATLAYYYLLADPDATFLMFYGGFEPGTAWERHWTAAVAQDVGQPTAKPSLFASGPDPANAALTYRVYQRSYTKALVLFKPLSYGKGVKEGGPAGDESVTKHDLGGSYRPVRADGTLGEPVTSISLRNGEGAILIKAP